MAFAHLTLTLALLCPQGSEAPDPRLSSALTKAEKEKLNKSAKKWFQAWGAHTEARDYKQRSKLRRSLNRAKDKFMKDWAAKEKKAPLKHPGDLLAIFENVFPFKKQSATGQMKLVSYKGGDGDFWVAVPKGYKPAQAYPCIVMLPDRVDNKWTAPKDVFDKIWKGTEMGSASLVVTPKFKDTDDLDPIPDMSTENGDAQERANNEALLWPVLGKAQNTYRMDFSRTILDCGRGSSGYGLRVATHFPARFSGLILRHPVDVGNLRLDSLTGTPVLIISSKDTKEAADKISKKLNEQAAGTCKVLEAEGESPYPTLSGQISEWAQGVARDLYRRKVIVAPNQDRWLKAYWVEITAAESVFQTAADERALLIAEADRDANRITITARNVSKFRLFLNDALLDLDKDFTVVINGKAITEKRDRSLFKMTELIFTKRDSNYIFTAEYVTSVPKAEGTSQGTK